MQLKLAASAAAIMMSFAASAMAVPTVSGNYIVTSRSFCQSPLAATSAGSVDNDIHSVGLFINDQRPGDEHYVSGIGKVDPVAGTLKFNGFQDGGSVLTLTTDGGTGGGPITEVPISGTWAFTITDTTFSFNGQTYHAFYGAVNKKTGIAYFVELAGLQNQSPPSCNQQIELTRQ